MYRTLIFAPFLFLCAIINNFNLVKSALLFTTNSEYGVISTQVLVSYCLKTKIFTS